MLSSLLLLSLFVLSVTARPLRPSASDHTPRSSLLSPSPAHVPPPRRHADLANADRRLPSPPLTSKSVGRTPRQSSRRFIMAADYASASDPPALSSKWSHKRADGSLSGLLGSTDLRYNNFHQELPRKLPSRSTPA
ncbi:hypothetical protein F5148DRAFT_1295841 [Russula earlei]|uniref:Uncharacterized protein n=1 Tax=Russula earlei TaxID=71964 RepID=A0ACC0TQP9_9AGAM|nr:hypothetical protein F5148DRAFT_1295841 [Russula earlei]